MLDGQGTFGEHIKTAVGKAEKKASALSRLLPNIGGPSSKKRELLVGVVHSTLLYGAPVWHKALQIERYRKMMEGMQRKMLLRLARGYRTVSARALQVITATIPIEIMARERKEIHAEGIGQDQEARAIARQRSLDDWQQMWTDNEEVGAWTKKLIPNIATWAICQHRRSDYFLTQALSGHGCFKTYTKRIGKTADDLCMYCGLVDTAEHTIFECGRWERNRSRASSEIGQVITVGNLVTLMTTSRRNWAGITRMVTEIMSAKESDERQHQQRADPNP